MYLLCLQLVMYDNIKYLYINNVVFTLKKMYQLSTGHVDTTLTRQSLKEK